MGTLIFYTWGSTFFVFSAQCVELLHFEVTESYGWFCPPTGYFIEAGLHLTDQKSVIHGCVLPEAISKTLANLEALEAA